MVGNDWNTLLEYLKEKRPLTTFQVSKICGVVHSTVSNWVKEGKLTAYRTPGGHRRIHLKDLRIFIKLYEISIPTALAQILELNSPDPDLPKPNPGFVQLNLSESRVKKKILVIEDDPNMLEIMLELLKCNFPNYELRQASDGFEAGRQMTLSVPDLVILDLFLPLLDGFQIIRHLRQDAKLAEIKVVTVTGSPTPETLEKLESAGSVDALFVKPVDFRSLLERIEHLLEPSLVLKLNK